MLHQDKKRWKQVKHHWFDIVQPIQTTSLVKILYNSVLNMSQSYFLCERKSWKLSWNELFFPSLPTYFLFHNTCLQSKNWWTLQKRPNPEIFKLQDVRSWNQNLEFYISYHFFRTDVLHHDKKRWKQVKHHWFDIVQPIRPHLRWKFFTISGKNVSILFSMWQESENFHGINCFFLHCHPISYFHNTCLQSKNWWTLWNDWIQKFLNFTIPEAEVKF